MKIVVLDGYTLNPGDLTWQPIESLGDLTVYDRTPSGEVIDRSLGAGILLTNKTNISQHAIAHLPSLRYIGVLATGYNVVDVNAALERGITVTNIPGYSSNSATQLVFALVLELIGHTSDHVRAVREGRWVGSPDWCFTVAPIHELAGKMLGIVGLGAIGRRVAFVGHAFGMRVIAVGKPEEPPTQLPGFRIFRYPLDGILALSDVLTLHCPLTPETAHLMNAERLSKMKRTAILINTARGPLIDEPALADALRKGIIAGAGLDVLSSEPPSADNPLLTAPRCVITPHIAWASVEARKQLMQLAGENIRAFLDGRPKNVVSG
ncbi:MAG: D-2-hydroxyacid dehydrogenase [Ignavibacteria bacterium]|nr:D-2-hydroxyacid dehydrogenase [Ignavibacteria bacterium]